jgi:hypothetical protein
MKKFDVKYGFYTTYTHTIFLKKERRNDEWVLWHSRPISNTTRSIGVGQTLNNLLERVSVRECFLYLQTKLANGDWHSVNKSGDWYVAKKTGSVDLHKYYADDDPNTQPGTSGPMVPGVPTKQAPPRQSPRNPQPSTGKTKKTVSPERSTPRPGNQQRFIELKHDEKSSALDRPSAQSRSGQDSATSSSRIFSSGTNSDLRQSSSRGSEDKGSRFIEQSRRAYHSKQIQRYPESSEGKSQPREKLRLPDARIQPSTERISSLGKNMPNLRAKDTERQDSTTDTDRGVRRERKPASSSRCDLRTKSPRSDQPRLVSGNRGIQEGRRHHSEEEKRSRTRVEAQKS